MSNPLYDLVAFLTAETGDFDPLGAARYVIVLVFYALMIFSLILFVANVRDDREQRTGRAFWLWVSRVLTGCLWFQAMLWTLPFGSDNRLHGWMEQMAGRAAYPELGRWVSDTLLPNFGVVDPLAFLAAFGIAAALVLGLFVRLAGFGAAVLCLALWLGLYNQRPGDPAEWSWGAVVMAIVCGTFSVFAAGRALGADAWLRRNVASVRERRAAGLLLRLLT